MKKVFIYFLVSLFVFTFSALQAKKINDIYWQVTWINNNQSQDKTNSWIAFRKQFDWSQNWVKNPALLVHNFSAAKKYSNLFA